MVVPTHFLKLRETLIQFIVYVYEKGGQKRAEDSLPGSLMQFCLIFLVSIIDQKNQDDGRNNQSEEQNVDEMQRRGVSEGGRLEMAGSR